MRSAETKSPRANATAPMQTAPSRRAKPAPRPNRVSGAALVRALSRGAGNAAVERRLSAGAPLVGDVEDPLEREADSIAGRVSPNETHDEAGAGTGSPTRLPVSLRRQLTPSLGAGLEDVRVHTDVDAAAAAKELGASAFTSGDDVYLGAGKYQPGTTDGRRLLAHEATHTVQQRRTGAPALQRQAEATTAENPHERLRRLLGEGSGREVVELAEQLTDADRAALAVSTPVERAGLIRILTDLTWTTEREESATVWLLRWGGGHAQVVQYLDLLGYRQKVLDSVDTDALHSEVVALFADADRSKGASVSVAPGASAQQSDVRRVLDVPEPSADEIRALPFASLQQASDADRLRMLQILIELTWSNRGEESRMLDILESSGSGLQVLMNDLTALGLKQRLFDHIDDEANKARFVTLLKPLNDPVLNEDLKVFQRGFWEGVGEGFSGAWEQIKKSFSLEKVWEIVRGLVRPILHPIDSIIDLIDQAQQFIQEPSLYRIVTFLRDLAGFVAMWAAVISGVLGFVGGFLVGLLVTSPVGAALLGASGLVLTVAVVAGELFITFAFIRLILDAIQAGTATTAVEARQSERRIAEDIQLFAVIGALKGIGKFFESIRGPAAEPETTTPDEISDATDAGKDANTDLKSESDATSKAAEQAKADTGVAEPADGVGDGVADTVGDASARAGGGAGSGSPRAAASEGGPRVIRVPVRGGGGGARAGGGMEAAPSEMTITIDEPVKPEPIVEPDVIDGEAKLPGVGDGEMKFPGVTDGDVKAPGLPDGQPMIDPGTPASKPGGTGATATGPQLPPAPPATDVATGPEVPVETGEPVPKATEEVAKPEEQAAKTPKPKKAPVPLTAEERARRKKEREQEELNDTLNRLERRYEPTIEIHHDSQKLYDRLRTIRELIKVGDFEKARRQTAELRRDLDIARESLLDQGTPDFAEADREAQDRLSRGLPSRLEGREGLRIAPEDIVAEGAPELPVGRIEIEKLNIVDSPEDAAELAQIFELAKTDPTLAGIRYEAFIRRKIPAVASVERPGRRPDVGAIEITIEGRDRGFTEHKIGQLWVDLTDVREIYLILPRLSPEALRELRRIGAQAERRLSLPGRPVTVRIRVRETGGQ